MTFKELQEKVFTRVDEDILDVEESVLKLIKDAINNGYMLLTSLVDKRTAVITLALEDYNNKLPLPNDFVELVIAEHELLGEINPATYEKTGDLLYFKSRDLKSGDVSLTYVSLPKKLENDTDELILKELYIGAITAYAAYVYQLSKKKYSAAQMLLQEFNSYIPRENSQAVQQAMQEQQ